MVSFLKYLLGILLVFTSCSKSAVEKLPVIIDLNSDWKFSQADKNEWLPATVPGTVHADLLINGIIKNPHYKLQENDVQWIEKKDWIYKTEFVVLSDYLKHQAIELHLKGLDTYADVYLNDTLILKSDNMFVGHSLNVKEYLKEGENELKIYFHSPVNEGMEKLKQLDYLIPAPNELAPENERTSIFTRKAPFHYGWDWGPRLVASGIWQPVYLKAWNAAIIEDVYLQTLSAGQNNANILTRTEIEVENPGIYKLSILLNDSILKTETQEMAKGINTVKTDIEIANPKLWWTNGLGEPYMYDFMFVLEHETAIIDKQKISYGIRTLRIIQEADKNGRTFHVELNGVPLFMKGSNIIPPNTLTPSVTKDDYLNMVKNGVYANMNMFRIWGGAIYGEDYLYELCDRHGILVWQDFIFSCALQPGNESHLENIAKEAEYNIKRLRNHPSLALWCGNNEIFHGWHHWGWKEKYAPEINDSLWKTYEHIFYSILPEAVSKHDPSRYYHSSSPIAYANRLADRKSGDEHDWTIWFGQRPFIAYGNRVPRFVSEYGMQSFPGMRTMKSFSTEEDWNIDSDVLRHRQRSMMEYVKPGFNGNDMIEWYMGKYYDIPENFEDFVYVSQLLQALGYKTAIESHRRDMPQCMGSLYWQLNDCWPTVSWSTVDFNNRWKAAHYAVRKAYEPVILTAVTDKDKFHVYAVSDKQLPFGGELIITSLDFNGKLLFSAHADVIAEPGTSTLIYTENIYDLIGITPPENSFILMELKTEGDLAADNVFFFNNHPKELNLPKDINVNINILPIENGYALEIYSDKFVKNLYLDLESEEGFFSDNFFDLIPNVIKHITVQTESIIVSEDDIIMKSLNALTR